MNPKQQHLGLGAEEASMPRSAGRMAKSSTSAAWWPIGPIRFGKGQFSKAQSGKALCR